jgi:hypothetical protein
VLPFSSAKPQQDRREGFGAQFKQAVRRRKKRMQSLHVASNRLDGYSAIYGSTLGSINCASPTVPVSSPHATGQWDSKIISPLLASSWRERCDGVDATRARFELRKTHMPKFQIFLRRGLCAVLKFFLDGGAAAFRPVGGGIKGGIGRPANLVPDRALRRTRLPPAPHRDNLVAPARGWRVAVRRPFSHQAASLIE